MADSEENYRTETLRLRQEQNDARLEQIRRADSNAYADREQRSVQVAQRAEMAHEQTEQRERQFRERMALEHSRERNRQELECAQLDQKDRQFRERIAWDGERERERQEFEREQAHLAEQFRIEAEYRRAKVEGALEEIRGRNALELQRSGALIEFQRLLATGSQVESSKARDNREHQTQVVLENFLTNATAIISHKLELKRQEKTAELEMKRMEHALELERLRIDGDIRKMDVVNAHARATQTSEQQHSLIFNILTSELKDRNLTHEEYTKLAVRLLERAAGMGYDGVDEERVKEWVREFENNS